MTGLTLDISVVAPAYQEADNLELLLPRLIATLAGMGVAYEILVVDTATPLDATPEICARFAASGVVHLPRREGPTFGSAVRTGIAASRGRSVVFMDADGSHDPELIRELYAARESADVVIASRYVAGGRTANPPVLKLMSLTVNIAFRIVFQLDCRDVSNSYRLYDGAKLRALALRCENFDIVEEILIRLKRADRGLRLREIPSHFHERKHGRTKRQLLLFVFTFVLTLIRLRFMR